MQDLLSHRAIIQPFQGESGKTVLQFKGSKQEIGYIIFTNSFNPETVNGVRLLMRKLKENY